MNPDPIQFFTEDIEYTLRDKTKIRNSLNRLILDENFQSGPINFIFCSDRFLLKYNEFYLKSNTFTDVITFDFSEEEGYISGDIYISIERIRENAKVFRVNLRNELERVMIHGILHLMGMEDNTEEEKNQMREKENRYMQKLKRD